MTYVVLAVVLVCILAFRIWIESMVAKSRLAEPGPATGSDSLRCYKHCDELARVESLVKGLNRDSRAYKLFEAARSRLAIERPSGLYQWRQQFEVDDMHEEALGFLTEAEALAVSN